MNLEISIKKEKAIVLLGTLGAAISGYLIGMGKVAEGGLIGAVTTALVTFWSEGVNTA
jgi:hypothetical protein